jgi:hemerythrin-like domain-containing protein
MLDEIKLLEPASSEFKEKFEQLRSATMNHINQEEKDIFTIIKDNFSDEQQKQMATEFKTVKSQLQKQIAVSSSNSKLIEDEMNS